MNTLDRDILTCLLKDSAMTISEIAQQVHSSKSTVHYHIQKMKHKGLILRHSISLDLSKEKGYHSIACIHTEPMYKNELLDLLENNRNAIQVFESQGYYQFTVEIFAVDKEEYDHLLSEMEKLGSITLSSVSHVIKKNYIPL